MAGPGEPGQPLDHGALVPLWFLAEAGWKGPTVIASLNYPGEGGCTSFGEAIGAAAKSLHRRIAFIASGEMAFAYFQAHAPRGLWPIQNGGELAVLYCFLFLYFAARGNGALSVQGK